MVADSPPQPAAAMPPDRPFSEVEFVVVDLETTGWSPEEARITEIGAAVVSGGQVREEFSTLVNPGRAIPAAITALTGIDDAMVAGAPPLARVLPVFLGFAGDRVLIAHNAPFDVGFLTAACRACGLPWPGFQILDTAELARELLADEVPDRKLSTLAAFFRARTLPRHRALADALATADVLVGLLRRLIASGVSTLAEIGGPGGGTLPASDGHRPTRGQARRAPPHHLDTRHGRQE